MPITPENPFKGRQYPGDVTRMAVRWYLRYPLAYEHAAELLAERELTMDRSCVPLGARVWTGVEQTLPALSQAPEESGAEQGGLGAVPPSAAKATQRPSAAGARSRWPDSD